MSPPSRGAWIEIIRTGCQSPQFWMSPPSRGAWIEIEALNNNTVVMTSPPSRGAWIEIRRLSTPSLSCDVAPLAGGVD